VLSLPLSPNPGGERRYKEKGAVEPLEIERQVVRGVRAAGVPGHEIMAKTAKPFFQTSFPNSLKLLDINDTVHVINCR
jgi:hypothetical protein